jgi:SAM-dependent methyltransferase
MAEQQDGLHLEAELWAGPMGERWLAHLESFEATIADIGEAGIAAAAFLPGERVIDIGCGGGATSLAIARLVGPAGSVTGLDISPVLTAAASERARGAGVDNVRFITGDAATATVAEPPFDRLFSRFGVMFFGDPHGAFAHMHGFLRPGGRLDFICWGPVAENAWVAELGAVISAYASPPDGPPPSPRAPGPFAFAEPGYVREILQAGGFSQVEISPWRGGQYMGGRGSDPRAAARFATEALPFGDALSALEPNLRQRAQEDLEAMFARHLTPEGVNVPSMAWFVYARA